MSLINNLTQKIKTFLSPVPKSKNEVIALLRLAEKQTLLNQRSMAMLENILQMAEMRVDEVMIPRSQMTVLHKDHTIEQLLPIVLKSAHSRFPVVSDNRDEVIGVLLAKDLLQYMNNGKTFNLKEVIISPSFVPESTKLATLLNDFQKNRNHLAVVVDEYGSIVGLVTLEDIVEQIVGDIEDEHDIDEDVNILRHEDNRHTVKAITPIEDFNAYFSGNLHHSEVDTIGGLIIKNLNRLPVRGEQVTIDKFLFTILRSDNRRVHLLRVENVKE